MALSMKKAKNNRMGLFSSNSRPPMRFASFGGLDWSRSTALCHRMPSTTGMPSSPTSSSAPRQPMTGSSKAITGGATAKPRLPVKLCSAKARPRNSLRMDPARMA